MYQLDSFYSRIFLGVYDYYRFSCADMENNRKWKECADMENYRIWKECADMDNDRKWKECADSFYATPPYLQELYRQQNE